MALESQDFRDDYVGTGAVSVYDYNFKIFADADLLVTTDDDGTPATLVLDTDYTVQGAGDEGGGTITLLAGVLGADIALAIVRHLTLTQDTEIRNQGPFYPRTIEDALDRLVMLIQQLQEQLDRSIRLPITEAGDEALLTLPAAASRASKYFIFNADGEPSVASAVTPNTVTVSTFMATLLDDLTAAAGRVTLGFSGAGGTVATANLEALAVTAAKIASDAVTTIKLLDGNVTTAKIAAAAVDVTRLATNALMAVPLNIGLAATVAANALTFSLKGADGSAPSASNPVKIPFRATTATSGIPTVVSVESALTLVVSAGSTLATVSAVSCPLYVYAINNAGTVELAVSGTKFADEGTLVNTTAEGGAGAADLGSVLYSTTARTGVACKLIGRIKATEATAGTWATAPSEISLAPFESGIGKSEIYLTASNAAAAGHGSSSTKIRRFLTTVKSIGNAITYADSATLGATFTINETGLYDMGFCDVVSSTVEHGISVNSTQLTTNISSITNADRLAYVNMANDASPTPVLCAHAMSWLNVGDVVRAHTNGASAIVSDVGVNFRIVKVA